MSRSCEPASRERIRAFRAGDNVLILAEGELPNPGYDVDIRPDPRRIFPTQYDLLRCPRTGFFPAVITPYRHVETVRFPEGQERITVHHADGADQVSIEQCGDDLALYREAVQGSADRVVPDQVEEAVGFSAALSFEDAFADALANLPASELPFADALARVQVVETGGLFGGFPGFHHLFVRVSRTFT